MPSAPELIPLRQLRRAEENVRHIRPDEDIEGLAADIAKHGLLANLIGYRDADRVMIVGGGRRLQALDALCNDFRISVEFTVPVLVRDRDEAVELSLAENLQQRTMSPVDEFMAFKALMDRGDTSPAELAKRFGWKERTVKQRLRLAELAPEVLEALAERAITLDAAMAYATCQDRHLQTEVFKIEARRTEHRAHRPVDIRQLLAMRGRRTDDPLFLFVGADAYERRGGRYDDGLFTDEEPGRILADPFKLETVARELIDFQMMRVLSELQRRDDLSPTIDGYVLTPDLRIRDHGSTDQVTAPPGFVRVERWDHAKLWRTIRNNGIEARALVGINDKGALVAWPQAAFVPAGQRQAVEHAVSTTSLPSETDEQRAARLREAAVLRRARLLAVGPFTGTPFEGRAYWPIGERYAAPVEAKTIAGVEGQLVTVQIFVSNEQVQAQRAAAEAAYDAEIAARASGEASA